MNEKLDWTVESDRCLTTEDLTTLKGEAFYTLKYADFLRMPNLDFNFLSKEDPNISVLYN